MSNNDDYKEFEIHPDMPKIFPSSSACDYKKVSIRRDTVKSVREDNEDPEGFLILTTCGKLHVKADYEDLMAWLQRGVTAKDKKKEEENKE